jgi:hypothetical protein
MLGKQITFDPVAWTGPTTSDWPSPDKYPMPPPLSARPSLAKHLILPAVSLAVAGLALKSLMASRPDSLGGLIGLPVMLVAAAFFTGVGLWRSRQLMQRNEPSVELSARGLSYPSFIEKTVPWSEVYEVEYVSAFLPGRKGRFPGVRVKIRDLDRFGPKWPKTVMGLDVSSFRLEFVPLPGMLDVWPRQLYRAIEAHRAHFGRGGRPLPGGTR